MNPTPRWSTHVRTSREGFGAPLYLFRVLLRSFASSKKSKGTQNQQVKPTSDAATLVEAQYQLLVRRGSCRILRSRKPREGWWDQGAQKNGMKVGRLMDP